MHTKKKSPIEENVHSDFYLRSINGSEPVYLEFWGLEDDPKYLKRKMKKKEIYAKYNL